MENSPEEKFHVTFARIKFEPQEVSTQDTEKCSICWVEPPVNAIKLGCNHLFCFLCIKSVVNTANNLCPLCREEIDANFDFGNLEIVGDAKLPTGSPDGYYWFYQGKTGWWLYDADTNKQLEEAYQRGEKRVEKLIAGQVYTIRLIKLKQYQKNDKSRTRKICREKMNFDIVLGVAGLRNKEISEAIRRRQINPNVVASTSEYRL